VCCAELRAVLLWGEQTEDYSSVETLIERWPGIFQESKAPSLDDLPPPPPPRQSDAPPPPPPLHSASLAGPSVAVAAAAHSDSKNGAADVANWLKRFQVFASSPCALVFVYVYCS
jgi:hypothetical protein